MRRLLRLRRHLTFANIAAAMALVVASSGTAYAAATITGADVVDGSLAGADLKNGTVKSIDIGNRTILAADLADGAVLSSSIEDGTIGVSDLSVAAQGALEGPQGDPGVDGVSGYEMVEGSSPYDSVSPKAAWADCPSGKVAVGGGYEIERTVGMDIVVGFTKPWVEGHSWIVEASEQTATDGPWRIWVHAICVAVPTG
jgi:hypothetical protein